MEAKLDEYPLEKTALLTFVWVAGLGELAA
jgi:hypothetical protein